MTNHHLPARLSPQAYDRLENSVAPLRRGIRTGLQIFFIKGVLLISILKVCSRCIWAVQLNQRIPMMIEFPPPSQTHCLAGNIGVHMNRGEFFLSYRESAAAYASSTA